MTLISLSVGLNAKEKDPSDSLASSPSSLLVAGGSVATATPPSSAHVDNIAEESQESSLSSIIEIGVLCWRR
jgi:hypothetical protein